LRELSDLGSQPSPVLASGSLNESKKEIYDMNFRLKFAVFGLLIGAYVPLHAGAVGLQVNVPFAFVAGGKKLPAGNYSVQETGPMGLILIQGRGHGLSTALLTTAEGPYSSASEPGLTFVNRGGEKCLSRVQFVAEPARLTGR
jgi:hypothetical protein